MDDNETTMNDNGMPKTLLEYVGVSRSTTSPDSAALILIDYQNEYLDGSLFLSNGSEACHVAAELLDMFRQAHAPIIHVVHHSRPGAALFDPDTSKVNILDTLTPSENETVVVKSFPNAFVGTELENVLRATGRKDLVIAGFMTHMCVDSTVRAASNLGFRNFVVADACATRALPHPIQPMKIVSAEEVHVGALVAIADRFASVIPRFQSS